MEMVGSCRIIQNISECQKFARMVRACELGQERACEDISIRWRSRSPHLLNCAEDKLPTNIDAFAPLRSISHK